MKVLRAGFRVLREDRIFTQHTILGTLSIG